MQKQGDYIVRPENYPLVGPIRNFKTIERIKRNDVDFGGELPNVNQPYMLWKDFVLDGRNKIIGYDYEDPRHQVCMCDTSTDCNSPTSWHDLGSLDVELKIITYFRGTSGRLQLVVTFTNRTVLAISTSTFHRT